MPPPSLLIMSLPLLLIQIGSLSQQFIKMSDTNPTTHSNNQVNKVPNTFAGAEIYLVSSSVCWVCTPEHIAILT